MELIIGLWLTARLARMMLKWKVWEKKTTATNLGWRIGKDHSRSLDQYELFLPISATQ